MGLDVGDNTNYELLYITAVRRNVQSEIYLTSY